MNVANLLFSSLFVLFEVSLASRNTSSSKIHLAPFFKPKSILRNRYIVVFKENTANDDKRRAIDTLSLARDGSTEILHEYSIINGIAATMSPSSLRKLRQNKDVKFIEQDSIVRLRGPNVKACVDQTNAEWCLERVASVRNDLRKYVYSNKAGSGVTVYVIDTGVNVDHVEFQGRAKKCANFVRTESSDDLNGHGTGVASLVAGAKAGAAKYANICALKVLNARGSGSTSDIIAAINWVTNQPNVGIINLSLGGGFSQATNDAVNKASDKGHLVVVAAGNENQDACRVSPASAEKALTVAASDENNNLASFSNYGKCIDIIAPGTNCYQASLASDKFKKASGTSFASPLTAGVAAVLWSQNLNANSAEITRQLLANAAKSEIKNVKQSVNVFLQSKCA